MNSLRITSSRLFSSTTTTKLFRNSSSLRVTLRSSRFDSRSNFHSLSKSNLLRSLSYEKPHLTRVIARGYSAETETDEDFDCRFEAYFSKPDIDGWEVRQGINNLIGYDCVPEPRIICAVLKACRRVSDYSLAVRFLEAVKFKCGGRVNAIYPYILQEIRPTLNELGVDTPEELGYDKPELWLKSIDEIH
ncbi:hypothetical protein LSTR_LSTR014000 [Laodelphax striatellus]|uniref:Cytochrome c oxidase subunit 5A, mitochondrial n=1 Tax=Laodelphax striatellus TaxID=195883 RepID=A0A482WTH1_LAOST|nr:hypothetical protein LSTR_LSTR014000 [Laodelphax striatellus]